jgi:DNA-binding NarL/FixJ family response regulator
MGCGLPRMLAGGAQDDAVAAMGGMERHRNAVGETASSASLSPQETRLPKLLTEGHRNKTAEAMGIGVHTVSFCLRSIYEE